MDESRIRSGTGDTMISFLLTAILAFLFYLLMVVGSGSVIFWSWEEITAGAIIGIAAGAVCRGIVCRNQNYRMANPVRIILILLYCACPFLIELTKANIDVAYRVITGNIRPGIVRLKTGMETDLGVTMLAHSITLTPGTLSVDIDEKSRDLFVHMINIDEETQKKEFLNAKEIFTFMDLPAWIRRIAE